MSVKQLSNGKRMDGIYTPTLVLNTESVATFITTCYLKKVSKTNFLFVFIEYECYARTSLPALAGDMP